MPWPASASEASGCGSARRPGAWAPSWARWSARPASARSSRPAPSAGAARRSATSTCWPRPTDGTELIARFTAMPGVEQVLAGGRHKAAVRLRGGPQVDLMVMPPGEVGAYLVHFTGSAAHNVRLRGLARDRGWSLSEHGFVRLGDDGRPLEGAAADRRAFATEAEVYAFLDLPYIDPELREDGGEIEAAQAGLAARPGHAGRPAGRCAQPLRLVGRQPLDRGGRRGDAPPRPRLPGPDRPLAQPDHRPRPDHRSRRATARHHRRAQRALRARGGGRRRARGRPPRRLPTPARLRDGDPRRRRARLPRRAAGALRRRRGQPARRSPTTARAADGPLSDGAPEPPRRHHRPPVGPEDRRPRRPRPGLGRALRAGGRELDAARDQRLGRAARPGRRPHPARRMPPAAASSSTRTPTIATSTTTWPGASAWHGVAGSRRATSSTRDRARPSSRGWPATATSERLDSA